MDQSHDAGESAHVMPDIAELERLMGDSVQAASFRSLSHVQQAQLCIAFAEQAQKQAENESAARRSQLLEVAEQWIALGEKIMADR